MALFSSKTIFTTHEQIKQAIFHISSLDYKEREIVYEALIKELDDGGITADELKRVVRELREKKLISEIDKANLLKLIA